MTEGQFLHYDGPAAIGGTEFPNVSLREHRESGGLRSWDGSATITIEQGDFAPDLAGNDALPVQLPDGRHGKALVTNARFDGHTWRLDLLGTGPAPGYAQT